MAKNLVIVESPAKAKTIEKFLGKDYQVESSYGHIADLPSKELGIDVEGDLTTTLVNNKECSFVIFEKGIAKCSIEKAYNDKVIDFKKPISCHLFPIRITHHLNFDAINYEKIKICEPACKCGSDLKIPLFMFLKQAIVRKYGVGFYNELIEISKDLKSK